MNSQHYSVKARHVIALAVCFLMATTITSLLVSQAVVADSSAAPAATDGIPAGTIVSWAGESNAIPAGWLLCNGNSLSKNKFRDLFKAVGTSWGGSGNRFNLPDLRGRFLRGVDNGTGRDPDRNKRKASNAGGNNKGLGSVQEDALQRHAHQIGPHNHTYNKLIQRILLLFAAGSNNQFVYFNEEDRTTSNSSGNIGDPIKHKTKSSLKFSEETRPKNAAVHWIIKAR